MGVRGFSVKCEEDKEPTRGWLPGGQCEGRVCCGRGGGQLRALARTGEWHGIYNRDLRGLGVSALSICMFNERVRVYVKLCESHSNSPSSRQRTIKGHKQE